MKNLNKIVMAVSMITLALTSYSSYALSIGIIVGQRSTSSSTSNAEKMCILNALTDRHSNNQYYLMANDRSPRGSAEAATRLTQHNIDIAVLPIISNEAEPAIDIFKDRLIPYITTATSNKVISDPELGISTMPSNEHQAALLAQYFLDHFPTNHIHVVIDGSSNYSNSMSQSFIMDVIEKRPEQKIYRHILYAKDFLKPTELLKTLKNGDIIFAPLFNPQIAMLYANVRGTMKKITIIGPDSIGGRKEFYEIVGHLSKKVALLFLKNWDNQVKGPNKNNLNAIVKSSCPNQKNTFLTTYTYDIIQMILHLPKNTKKKTVIHKLKKSHYINALDGVRFHFNKNGYNDKPMYLYRASQNGNILVDTLRQKNEK